MPAIQRGSAYKLASGRWGVRWRDHTGERHFKSPFPNKSAALRYFRDEIEPQLDGGHVPTRLTLAELVELFLERHAAVVRARTVATLRERLRHAVAAFGDVHLEELERMASSSPAGGPGNRNGCATRACRRSGRPSTPRCAGAT